MENIATFWFWLIAAFFLLVVEVLIIPIGFFLCAATAAGALAALTFICPSLPLLWGLTIFSFLLLVVTIGWWHFLSKKRDKTSTAKSELNAGPERFLGLKSMLDTPIKGGKGRIRINDSYWPCECDTDLPEGTVVEVIEAGGVLLKVKKTGNI